MILHPVAPNIEPTKSFDRTVQFYGKHEQKYFHMINLVKIYIHYHGIKMDHD